MKVYVTKNVAKHQTNEHYDCLVVQFEKSDTNFFPQKMNWLPKFSELKQILELMIDTDEEMFEYIEQVLEKRGYKIQEGRKPASLKKFLPRRD